MGILRTPRASTTERMSITPDVSELVYDIDLDQLFTGDGFTVGGNPLTRSAQTDSIIISGAASTVDSALLSRFRSIKWVVTLYDSFGNTNSRELLVNISQNGLQYTSYGKIGDNILAAVYVQETGTDAELIVHNQTTESIFSSAIKSGIYLV